jgi:hypothetical protein
MFECMEYININCDIITFLKITFGTLCTLGTVMPYSVHVSMDIKTVNSCNAMGNGIFIDKTGYNSTKAFFLLCGGISF